MQKQILIATALFSMVPHITIASEEASLLRQGFEGQAKTPKTTEATKETAAETSVQQTEQAEQPAAQETTTTELPTPKTVEPESTAPATAPEEVPMIPYEGTLSDETMNEIAESTTSEPTQTVIPTIPEPIKEEPIVIPEEPEQQEAPAGIDTVSLENPQGNWLYKRIWWERAEERYEKIRMLVDTVWGSRIIFFDKRNELDRNVLDPFYLNIGIGQGELQIILTELLDFFEKHREEQGDLNEQERALYETIATEEEDLKQLKQDVESIANLDHAIDEALGTLMNQINRVRQYERQAWENFKEIAHILNDTKARELYYMIEGAARNIKNINTYIEQDFFNHFAQLIGEATKHVNRIQNQIESLKEK